MRCVREPHSDVETALNRLNFSFFLASSHHALVKESDEFILLFSRILTGNNLTSLSKDLITNLKKLSQL